MSDERRAVPRAQYNGEVVASISGEVVVCKGIDLSEKGMAFSAPTKSMEAGAARVVLMFTLPKQPRYLVLEGVVVRVSALDRCASWAVRFSHVRPKIRRILRTFVFVGHGEVREFSAA